MVQFTGLTHQNLKLYFIVSINEWCYMIELYEI